MLDPKKADSSLETRERARAISKAGGVEQALGNGLPKLAEMTLSEAIVLGLLKQGVRKYFAIFGHGSTDLGNILRIYEEEGATRTINCRNEVEMAHAATALRWQYGELSAVVTSIGPGAMQAFAGSLASASNGVGVYHIYGDETTFGEGYNMQQVPKEEQGLFGRMTAVMGAVLCPAHARGIARCVAPRRSLREPSLSCRPVLSAVAAEHSAGDGDGQSRRPAGPARVAEACAG